MIHHKPFGIALGFLGNLAVGLAIHKLIGTGSCGGDLPACPDNLVGHIVMLPVGIVISMIAIFIGGGVFSFLGLFFAVGLGSMLAGVQSEDPGTQAFGLIFGGAFAGVAALVAALGWKGWMSGRRKVAKAKDLVRAGSRGIGTVKNVQDTHTSSGGKHEVRVTMRVEPVDGSPPFEVTKPVYVTRQERPKVGERFPVFYENEQRSNWAYATDVDPARITEEFAAAKARLLRT